MASKILRFKSLLPIVRSNTTKKLFVTRLYSVDKSNGCDSDKPNTTMFDKAPLSSIQQKDSNQTAENVDLKAVLEPVNQEPAAEVVEEPVAEVVEEPAAEVVEEPAAEVVEEPAAEVVEEPVVQEQKEEEKKPGILRSLWRWISGSN